MLEVSCLVVYPLTWTTAAVAGVQCLMRRLDEGPTTVNGDPRAAMPVLCATTESSDHPIEAPAPAPDPGRDRSPLASLG